MPLNTAEMMNALAIVSEHEHMSVAVKESAKGGVITGISAVCGGLLLGPLGLAIGTFPVWPDTHAYLIEVEQGERKESSMAFYRESSQNLPWVKWINHGKPRSGWRGTFGGVTSYVLCKDKFKPVPKILMEDLTVRQKQELARSVQAVLNDIRAEDAAMLASLILADRTLSITVLQLVTNFLRTQISAEVNGPSYLH